MTYSGYRLTCVKLLTLIAVVAVSTAQAADPQLSRIAPPGARRGSEVEIQFRGARLADAKELLFYDTGLKTIELKAAAGAVAARLAIAPDCRLGSHAVRVRTASGISNLKTFSVGALPETNEVEPNSEFDAPQKIALGTTVNGVVQNEDVDYFLVEAKKGDRIVAEVEGLRLGDTFFDPYVAILDAERFVLSGSDDTPLVRQDAVALAVVPEAGNYVVQIRESSFGGNGNCRYRLHVGSFPRPSGVFPAGGKLGQQVEVRYLGDPAGEWTEKVALPAVPKQEFGLYPQNEHGISPSANPFRLSKLDNVLESEPNNAPAQSTVFEGAKALNGIIGEPGDVDCYRFAVKKGQVYSVRVYARALRSPLDSVLQIRRSSGANVASNDDSGSPDSYVQLKAPADDEYVISVRDHLMQGSPEHFYRIEVSPAAPELTMGLPERAAYVDMVAPVPQGNRVAFMVSAQRQGFGGELNLGLAELPGGLSLETVPMAADRTLVPVLLSAAADAPLSGALADVTGRFTQGDRTVEGRLLQRTSLVRGQNNREVWNQYTDRMATAVTKAVPFRIEIVQPKVPLVQSGSMRLLVRATRDEGFDAPIAVRMLYNPPGVSAPNSVTIAKGKNEAALPLTANGNAGVRSWPVAVIGQATVGDGPVWVSSQLANLEVAPPYFKFNFPTVAVEQGQAATLVVGVEKTKDFDGAAKVELVGLPNEVTTEAAEITKDTTELAFPLATTAKSPAGLHKTLLCRAVVTLEGEPITHILGTGQLRIQKPLPAKPAAAAAKPTPQEKPAAKPPAAKPLSRLEQLRQQIQESEADGTQEE